MTTITEDAIRALAYQKWLDEGCPEGRSDIHWLQALAELQAAPAKAVRKRAPAKPRARKAA